MIFWRLLGHLKSILFCSAKKKAGEDYRNKAQALHISTSQRNQEILYNSLNAELFYKGVWPQCYFHKSLYKSFNKLTLEPLFPLCTFKNTSLSKMRWLWGFTGCGFGKF